KTIGAVSESSLLRKPELKRRVEARPHMLLIGKPYSARPILPGRRKPQHFSIGNRGVPDQTETLNRDEALEADRRQCRRAHAESQRDPNDAPSRHIHVNDYDCGRRWVAEGAQRKQYVNSAQESLCRRCSAFPQGSASLVLSNDRRPAPTRRP